VAPPAPVRNVYLTWTGVGFTSGYQWTPFDTICGPNPPTITGGYAKWTPLERPLQRALTIFQGYDPVQMTVDVIFGQWDSTTGWYQDDATGSNIEKKQIAGFEWMAGSNFVSGPSPAVYVYSHSTQGGDTDLIPSQYAGVPWVVTDLKWGTAYRNPNGYRIWQEATVTLQNYLNLNAPPKPDLNSNGGYFISKAGRDTALLIAGAPSTNSPIVDHQILAGRILSDARNNPMKGTSIRLARRSVYWKITHGSAVFVPSHQI